MNGWQVTGQWSHQVKIIPAMPVVKFYMFEIGFDNWADI
jgi:hypothetical protein